MTVARTTSTGIHQRSGRSRPCAEYGRFFDIVVRSPRQDVSFVYRIAGRISNGDFKTEPLDNVLYLQWARTNESKALRYRFGVIDDRLPLASRRQARQPLATVETTQCRLHSSR